MKKLLMLLTALVITVATAQEITYMTGNRGQDVDYAKAMAEEFMAEHEGVTINVLAGPQSATDRANQYLQYFEAQSGEVDLFQIDVIWPGDMAEHLVDLFQYEGFEDAVGDFFPAIVENNTVNGALVGMPYFTDAGLLYFRSDLLEEYGYDGPPATWAELEEMATTIQAGERDKGNSDFWGFVWQGNAYEGLTCDALEWVTSNGGGTIISPEGQITINNENAIAALEQAAGWVGTISPPGVTGFAEEDARGVWHAGNAAFMRNWPYAYGLTQDSEHVPEFGVSPLPAGEGEGARSAGTLGGWQLAINKYSENPDVAAEFVMFLTSEKGQLTRALELSNLPTREAVYGELEGTDKAFMSEFLPVFQNAVARPSTASAPNYLQTSQAFFTAVHSVLTGEEDAETALLILELDLEAITGLEIAN